MTDPVDLGGFAAKITVAGASHVGAVRTRNEDSYLARHPFAVVADGMGGHSHGERASRCIIDALSAIDETELPSVDDVIAAIGAANTELIVSADEGTVSGSTVSGVALVRPNPTDKPHWMVFNVGDSRVYRFDGRHLEQVSVDHSVVQELVELGHITPEAAAVHPDRNVITRAVGSDPALDIDVWLLPADSPQTFLVCSDGLTKELDDDFIADVLASHDADASGVVDALVAAALAVGGHDNITAVLFEYIPDETGDDVTATRQPVLEDTRPRG
ncbi:PP2C family serine/threonine-protein phosphatase [Herbiconiux sp. L3-i23]|uniref:PP2C family protein-serine/threonine phosphatase n=1 Tax=Herbiconiux sp. L3-i23 TaxID=2905871 RepID=UPI0020463A76|nr:protein phosphatase 2C domain-containing protein [Herbiconiux sp. L3-i23]BDI21806.1 serine/threonine protein phosphatase [Herbiconiux sp. L3-i23]